MKIKKITKFLVFVLGPGVIGITLAPFGIYLKEDHTGNKVTVNHESIHWKQQMEILIIPFYIWYLLEWGIKIFIYGKNAYRNISFEKESYNNDNNLDYLKKRKPYNWIKLIF